jgi:hypothetical protein
MGGADVGYSGTPLVRKLGIQPGHRILVDGDPDELDPQGVDLSSVPGDATLHRRLSARSDYDVALLFAPNLSRLTRRWPALHGRTTQAGALWVCWPKKASRISTDLDDDIVREYGLANGRVDVKVAAISTVWSGQKFVVRLADRDTAQ